MTAKSRIIPWALVIPCWCSVGLLLTASRADEQAHGAGGPCKLTAHAQLLLDDRLVERCEGLKRTIHQPQMHPANPVLKPDQPWEYAAALLWGTVIYDDQEHQFKMWYMTWGNDAGGALPGWRTPVCYATSSDGIRWEKPKLALHAFKMRDPANPDGPPRQYPENNIVYDAQESPLGMDSPTVVKDDADPDPKRRYKMSFWDRLPSGAGIYQAVSPDGLHWTRFPEMVVHSGDRNHLFFDPFAKKWVVLVRAQFYDLNEFGVSNANHIRNGLNVDDRDREMFPNCRMYSFPVAEYEGMLLGFPEMYTLDTNRWVQQLAWSYDGVNWSRDPDRVQFMPWNDVPGTFDCWRRNPHNGGFIRRDNKLWLYFSGRSQGKDIEGRAGFLVPSGEPGFDPRGIVGAIGIAILRVDGFCSRNAGADEGTLITKPLIFDGSRLQINADIRPGGYVKAGFVDADSHDVAGFSLRESAALSGDHVAHSVSWKGQTDLASLAGKPVRLCLKLKQADIYSFRFANP